MNVGRTYTLGELAERFSLKICARDGRAGVDAIEVTGFSTLQQACDAQISFFSNAAYRNQLRLTRAAAVILRESDVSDCPVPSLVSDNPYLAYAKITALFDVRKFSRPGIHPSAVIHPTATVSATAHIGSNVVVEEGVHIGHQVVISAGCTVARNSRIGERSYLYPRVVIYHDVRVGNDVILHSGVVLGADGFGYAKDAQQWCKIHQLGGVIIGDRVEIGANSCVDRGALDDTVIGDGVIIDNLVQIAHNVKIGANTAIAACTGIAGSTVIGSGCTIAGAVGIVGHLTIADGVHITAKSLVTGSISQSGSYSSGTAIQETSKWRKNAVRFLQLDNLFDRVRVLESRFNAGK